MRVVTRFNQPTSIWRVRGTINLISIGTQTLANCSTSEVASTKLLAILATCATGTVRIIALIPTRKKLPLGSPRATAQEVTATRICVLLARRTCQRAWICE